MNLHEPAQRYRAEIDAFNARFPEGSDTPGVTADQFADADQESDDRLVLHGADLASGVLDARETVLRLLRELHAGVAEDAVHEQDGQSFTIPPARTLAAYVGTLFGIQDSELWGVTQS